MEYWGLCSRDLGLRDLQVRFPGLSFSGEPRGPTYPSLDWGLGLECQEKPFVVISLVLHGGEEVHVASPPFSQHQDSPWL